MMCDRVAIMQKGELIREGTVQELTASRGCSSSAWTSGTSSPRTSSGRWVTTSAPGRDRWEITLADGQSIDPVLRLAPRQGAAADAHGREEADAGRHLRVAGRGGRARGGRPAAEAARPTATATIVAAGATGTVRRPVPGRRPPRPPGGLPMMTKPIAILKDSLREAWDSKTLLVMLVLAGLFLVGVASIGYEAATPQGGVRGIRRRRCPPRSFASTRGKTPGRPDGPATPARPYPHPTYTLTTFRTVKEASHAADGRARVHRWS